MTQKVIVSLVSDISGEPATHTVEFSLGKMDYCLDLTDTEHEGFSQAMAPYVAHAQVVRVRGGKKTTTPQKQPGKSAEIRAWAKQRNIAVPERGRISADVEAQYDAWKNGASHEPATTPAPGDGGGGE